MRRRSTRPSPDDETPKYKGDEKPTPNGTRCPVDGCGLPQFNCPGGLSCDNGHGGVDEGEALAEERSPVRARSRLAESLSLREKIDALATPLDGVVERIFSVDFDAEYRRIEKDLSIGDVNDASVGELNKALDKSEENARIAHLLYCNAELQREAFDVDAEVLMADLRSQATARLNGEKKAGLRQKAITDADVRGMIALIAPDEWRTLSIRRKKIELAVEHLKRLADLWKNRCGTNETLVRTRR